MTEWRDRRVLVTGATGIVGSWLVARLQDEGAYVVALVRDWDPQTELIRSGTVAKVHVVSGRLEDLATVTRAIVDHETDTVFHLGAQTIVGSALREPLSTFEANIRGTYNLLEACRRHPDVVQRVVVASSDKAYGTSATLPYAEDMPLAGQHPYDVSKSCADLLATAYAITYGLPVCVARCGNIYGGGDLNWSRIVPGTIRSLLADEAPVLRSDGNSTRDYLFVDDAVDAYLRLAEAADRPDVVGQAFNFGWERPVSVLEITATIQRLMDREDLQPVVLGTATHEIEAQYLDSAKARRVLDWRPTFDLAAGLTRTIDWYREFLGAGNG
ncbi:MAG: CDP-glucose 4,6-dehydratase [Chloroflexota bacterium]|nr:CDP-glucose 4,6-dehydratase [Chloroflexota bacterium]